MSPPPRLVLTFCAAALLLGRAVSGCGEPAPDPTSASSSGSDASSSSSSSGGGSSSASSSSSSGACLHCSTVEMMGDASQLCPASKVAHDTLKMCKCGAPCSKDCAAACGGASLDSTCLACLDAQCHNQIATCIADQ